MSVTRAVIPAAGLGTRFLPATKALPKEMIPIVDKPAIQYAVEEAAAAGIDDVLVITSRAKTTIEDHFDRSPELERRLEQAGKEAELEAVRAVADLASIHYVRQTEPLGFGHAVSIARSHVGSHPFAVLVPDEIVPAEGDSSLLAELIRVHDDKGASALVVQEVPRNEVSAYGIVAPEWEGDDLARVVGMVEKPSVDDAPSTLAARGRYVFTPAIFDALERTSPGVGGEIQLTDAIKLLADDEPVYAYLYRGRMLDVGRKLDYLRASIEIALQRPDIAGDLRRFIDEITAS